MIAVYLLGSAILAGLNVVVWSAVALGIRMLFSRATLYRAYPALAPATTPTSAPKTSWMGCLFLALVGFIFWVGGLAEKPIVTHPRRDSHADPRLAPAPAGD